MSDTDNTSTVLVVAGTNQQRLFMATAGFLSGYKPTTRASYDDGLKQWFRWCAQTRTDPFEVQRPHIDLWGRYLEEDSMGHADPRTTTRYWRHRGQLDRNSTHLVTAFLAAG